MRVLQSFSTSVGSKILVALTGLALVGFLVFHLAGNLLLFFGPASFNDHSHELITNPLIIPAELGLAAIFVMHIVKALGVFVRNRAARPVAYEKKRWAGGASRKSLSSSTMILTGPFILAFVILHLATFKYGTYYAADTPGERDLYRLVLDVFHQPGYVVFYVVSMLIIGMHLRHGISSSLQSAGLIPEGWTSGVLRTCYVLAIVTAGGFLILPVWVYLFR